MITVSCVLVYIYRRLVKKQQPYHQRTCLETKQTNLASLMSRVCQLTMQQANLSQRAKERSFANSGKLRKRNTRIISQRDNSI